MKIKPANEIIGSWVCSSGGKAEVYQTIKAGRHFYTRCDCCGLNQGTGKARQQKIYNEAVFNDKASIAIPTGVDIGAFLDAETPGRKEDKPEEKPTETQADFNPNEIENEPEVKEGGGFLSKIAPVAVVLAAIGVGIWTS